MNRLIFLFVIPFLLSCTSHSNKRLKGTDLSDSNDSITIKYLNILDGLKYEYVLYYRDLKITGTDLETFGLPENESKYKLDSIKYFESSKKFFQQDYHFINWLLGFKNDTTNLGLWQSYLNPLSSHIGECNLPLSNSRAAINLIENFLNGKGFECYECGYKDNECNMKKYEELEKFLRSQKEKDIKALRNAWKIKNAR